MEKELTKEEINSEALESMQSFTKMGEMEFDRIVKEKLVGDYTERERNFFVSGFIAGIIYKTIK